MMDSGHIPATVQMAGRGQIALKVQYFGLVKQKIVLNGLKCPVTVHPIFLNRSEQ